MYKSHHKQNMVMVTVIFNLLTVTVIMLFFGLEPCFCREMSICSVKA